MRPLEGIRVLDFSHALAGPYCTMLMAQYGAEIYKIESPDGGDIGRSWGPPFTGEDASFFLGVNPGKRGVTIDLKRPEGVALCLDLIGRVDVLIENMRVGTLERLGLGYEIARARNPRLIYCSISGYGQTGPSREEAAMDLILQASSGLMSITGVEGGERVRCGHSVADISSGMFAMIGVLLAIEARHRSGTGQLVDVSMLDSMISAMVSNMAYFAGSGVTPGPLGTRFGSIVPYRGFATADRDLVIAVASAKLWPEFCAAIDRPDLAGDPRYATNALRVANREELEAILQELFRTNTCAWWIEKLRAHGIPSTPVRTFDEVAADPQTAVRQMFPAVDGFRVTGAPVKFSATPGCVTGPAPRLGEHTEEVLKELLGLDEAILERLRRDRIIHSAARRAGR
jgi:crotonobetainyl-CoA:carnitine CoA-transferase CaiB-like acyl-CoA transferase